MSTVSDLIKKLAEVISENSPVILTGMAVTGVVTTAILAVKATPKAIDLIDKKVEEKYEESKSEEEYEDWVYKNTGNLSYMSRTTLLTKKEIIGVTWKCYIPAAAVGVVTIACIIGAHGIHSRRNAALASLYSLTESAFKDYKSKVVETIGKNKELKIRDNLDGDEIAKHPVSGSEVIFTGKGETLCYDRKSGRYFKTDIDKVRKIQNDLNRDLLSEDFISLNEFYDEVGLPHCDLGDNVGWDINKSLIDINFSAQLSDDGTPCLVLNYDVVPKYF